MMRQQMLAATLSSIILLTACASSEPPPADTVAYYNAAAVGYRYLSCEKLIPGLITEHAPAATHPNVIDIGSGPGMYAKKLTDEGYSVLCVDPAEKMLEVCKEKGLKTHHSTWQDFTSTDQRFDLALALFSFIHLTESEWADGLAKVARVLNPNGVFIIDFFEGKGQEIFSTNLEAAAKGDALRRVMNFMTDEKFEGMLPDELEVVEKKHLKKDQSAFIYVLKKITSSGK